MHDQGRQEDFTLMPTFLNVFVVGYYASVGVADHMHIHCLV